MADSDDEGAGRAQGQPTDTGPVYGPIYSMWESSLEKLKILNYEAGYCQARGKTPFSRVQFVFPGRNLSHQFDDFVDICAWLCAEISASSGGRGKSSETFKREDFDDPNTVANKLMLALRALDFRSSFPPQKLRTAHGEPVCTVLEFLTDKALSAKNFSWGQPVHIEADEMEQPDLEETDETDVEDEVDGAAEDDVLYHEPAGADVAEMSLDSSAHQILLGHVDPIAWKTELERVGPKLKAQQPSLGNEWRAHVDQTAGSKQKIEAVLRDTQGDLKALNKDVAEELGKMKQREKYINNQFVSLGTDFKDVKQKLEELEIKSSGAHEKVNKLTNELTELTERTDDLKDSLESKDSGMNDTSPLVRMKAALQQIKAETRDFDLRVGVVSNSVLSYRIQHTSVRRRHHHHHQRNKKNWKGTRPADDNSLLSGEDD